MCAGIDFESLREEFHKSQNGAALGVASQSQDRHDMGWLNGFRQSFNFQCPHGEVLVALRSFYGEADGMDRLWSFEYQ
ncbi:hypothetical protein KUCAC02_024826 [Chaenocephalus aceratus]|nr:hypothetical protein KUCAC02_034623 [Chaenocephalus aceratus]KAI4797822.1 hypothetical protein KUCAC02_024826 [Chaenocephalus aceratus]